MITNFERKEDFYKIVDALEAITAARQAVQDMATAFDTAIEIIAFDMIEPLVKIEFKIKATIPPGLLQVRAAYWISLTVTFGCIPHNHPYQKGAYHEKNTLQNSI